MLNPTSPLWAVKTNRPSSATCPTTSQDVRSTTLRSLTEISFTAVDRVGITRFNELKVGDTVTFSYHAAVVYQILKPGDNAGAPAAGAAAVRGQGVKPSGAVTQQRKATVTVEAIDPSAPSVTLKIADGHKMSAQVEDKKNLEGLKVGDRVEVTFTEALMVTIDAPKK